MLFFAVFTAGISGGVAVISPQISGEARKSAVELRFFAVLPVKYQRKQ